MVLPCPVPTLKPGTEIVDKTCGTDTEEMMCSQHWRRVTPEVRRAYVREQAKVLAALAKAMQR